MAVRRIGKRQDYRRGSLTISAVEEPSYCPGMTRHQILVSTPGSPLIVRMIGLVRSGDAKEQERSWERTRTIARQVSLGDLPHDGPEWAPLTIRCPACGGDGCLEDPELPGLGKRCETCHGSGQTHAVA